jgi:hypothetical protein
LSGLFFDPVSDTASFIGTNTSTKGNWIGTFGSDGYNVINNAVKYPSDVTVTPTGQTVSKFVASTTDPRALQNAPGTASGRTAGDWYASTSFTVNVHITDTATYDLSLYLLDWSNIGRSEQVQITRARDGTVLSTQSVSSFSGGVYLTWAISGDVNITFTKLAGANAVLSGLFFDPAGSIASPSRSAAASPMLLGSQAPNPVPAGRESGLAVVNAGGSGNLVTPAGATVTEAGTNGNLITPSVGTVTAVMGSTSDTTTAGTLRLRTRHKLMREEHRFLARLGTGMKHEARDTRAVALESQLNIRRHPLVERNLPLKLGSVRE